MHLGPFADRINKLEKIAQKRKQQRQDYSSILDNHAAVRAWLNDDSAMPCPHRLHAVKDELSKAQSQTERKAVAILVSDIVLKRLKELNLFTGYMSSDIDHAVSQDAVSIILIDPSKYLYGMLTPECNRDNCLRFETDPLVTVKEYEAKRRQEWDSYCDTHFAGIGKHSTDDSDNSVLSVHFSAQKYE